MLSLQLQPDHDHAIRAHAQRAYPQECCGFLLGKDDSDHRVITKVIAGVNARGEEEQHNRFTISPEAFMRADKTARADRLDVLGFYHSHPDAPARPSAYDLEHAWPVYSYIILAVADGEPTEMTCWLLRDDRSGYDQQPIEPAGQTSPTEENH